MKFNRTATPILIALVVALAFLILAATQAQAGGSRLRVPADFGTIQAAVDAAQPGDVIVVDAGVYNENVLITKSNLELRTRSSQWNNKAVIEGMNLTGIGIWVLGTSSSPISGVVITGFAVENFERGVQLENAQFCKIQSSEVRQNSRASAPSIPEANSGVVLKASSFNELSGNYIHRNGNDGIILLEGSSGNTIQSNLIETNGLQNPTNMGAGIQLSNGANSNNQFASNEVRQNQWGIQLTSDGTGNVVSQNKVHDNRQSGIAVLGTIGGNVFVQNNSLRNGTMALIPAGGYDLYDELPVNNTWDRNKGRSNF